MVTRIALASILFGPVALASSTLDPMTGVRVSLAGTQSLLAVPPLPSLEPGGRSKIPVSAAYISGSTQDQVSSYGSYDGSFTGGALGVGYSSHDAHGGSLFGMLVADQMSGSIDIKQNDGSSIGKLSGMSTQGFAAAGGINFKLFGEAGSPFAFSVFGGPALLVFRSNFKFESALAGVSVNYSAQPLIYGAMGGLQMKTRIFDFLINPYALWVRELSGQCKSFTAADGSDSQATCDGESKKLSLLASFSAIGLNLGYGAFKFNVYSKVRSDTSLSAISIHEYQLSYSFGVQ